MGDRTGYTLLMDMADLTQEERQRIIEEVFDGYADEATEDFIAAYERSIGGVYDGDMTQKLQALLDEWGKDRSWRFWEDPKYEHLGTVCIHEPGIPDRIGDCDANGNLQVEASTLEAVSDGWRAAAELIEDEDAKQAHYLRRCADVLDQTIGRRTE